MFLSRVILNANLRETMQALTSPKLIHNTLEQGYKGDRHRILWRIDWLKGACCLLVLSPEQLDLSKTIEKYGFSNSRAETKKYNLLLNRLQTDQIWRFRLTANPVRSSFKERDELTGRGKVFAHVTPKQQKLWLLRKAELGGFSLKEESFDIVHTEWRKFCKNKESNHEVTLRIATFEGILSISDLDLFKKTLIFGIGRAKAYGCGLLTIAKCTGETNV